MTKNHGFWGPWRTFLLCWIFALVASGCGTASELAPAKSTSGQPASPAVYDEMADAEAPSEEPLPAEPPPPIASSLSGAVAQAGPARTEKPAADVPAPTPGIPPGSDPPALPTSPARAPLLIYTASMSLAVFETREAIGAVEELARSLGGYLVSRSDDTVTVRIPAQAFHGALTGVSKLGDELHREVHVKDVTEQFADLEIRLKNAEAVRQRLEALLAKAGKIEDALAVERELERITQAIEQMKGRMRLLGELVAFSTISVSFSARPHDQVGSEVRLPFDWLGGLGLPPLMNLEAP